MPRLFSIPSIPLLHSRSHKPDTKRVLDYQSDLHVYKVLDARFVYLSNQIEIPLSLFFVRAVQLPSSIPQAQVLSVRNASATALLYLGLSHPLLPLSSPYLHFLLGVRFSHIRRLSLFTMLIACRPEDSGTVATSGC
jgi:hypothetical protein